MAYVIRAYNKAKDRRVRSDGYVVSFDQETGDVNFTEDSDHAMRFPDFSTAFDFYSRHMEPLHQWHLTLIDLADARRRRQG